MRITKSVFVYLSSQNIPFQIEKLEIQMGLSQMCIIKWFYSMHYCILSVQKQ